MYLFSDINYGNTSTYQVSAKNDNFSSRFCQNGNSAKKLAHIRNFFDISFVAKFGTITKFSDLYHENTITVHGW